MTDILSLLIAKAYAAEGPAAPVLDAATNAAAVVAPAESGSVLMKFMPLFLIFAVFYFLVIRPQQKKLDDQTAMVKALKKGDKIVTDSGLFGTIARMEDEETVSLEIAKGVEVKMLRSRIAALADGAKIANENKGK